MRAAAWRSRQQDSANHLEMRFYFGRGDQKFRSRKLSLRRRTAGLSKQTSNHYVKAFRQFCRWLVRTKRLERDPTSDIPLLNVQTDRRHDRR